MATLYTKLTTMGKLKKPTTNMGFVNMLGLVQAANVY